MVLFFLQLIGKAACTKWLVFQIDFKSWVVLWLLPIIWVKLLSNDT